MKIYKFFIPLFWSSLAFSGDLAIDLEDAGCLKKDEWGNYVHAINFVIKNTSKEEITVITEMTGSSWYKANGDNQLRVKLTREENLVGEDYRATPRVEDLGLVTLRSGEVANVYYKFTNDKPINEEVIIEYSTSDIYEGRFNNWVGKIRSNKLMFFSMPACKP